MSRSNFIDVVTYIVNMPPTKFEIKNVGFKLLLKCLSRFQICVIFLKVSVYDTQFAIALQTQNSHYVGAQK